ncbi:hypothetical protein CDN99_07545 [Roseateles aquatilis]|uniref:Uncharacterized protein n=2 Tax=Roseateles aquatilis TaxID=431061 RepID=A0A246JHY7_9BURK|nr:hypothetical protein CDN99_07545 [Roseateles aquatilis]
MGAIPLSEVGPLASRSGSQRDERPGAWARHAAQQSAWSRGAALRHHAEQGRGQHRVVPSAPHDRADAALRAYPPQPSNAAHAAYSSRPSRPSRPAPQLMQHPLQQPYPLQQQYPMYPMYPMLSPHGGYAPSQVFGPWSPQAPMPGMASPGFVSMNCFNGLGYGAASFAGQTAWPAFPPCQPWAMPCGSWTNDLSGVAGLTTGSFLGGLAGGALAGIAGGVMSGLGAFAQGAMAGWNSWASPCGMPPYGLGCYSPQIWR